MNPSVLQALRLRYQPVLPAILQDIRKLKTEKAGKKNKELPSEIGSLFPKTATQPYLTFCIDEDIPRNPLRVGAVLSGGQAPGGHNVISGLYDALKALHPQSLLIGFLNGPDGILKGESIPLTEEKIANYRNQGGFDLIGSGRGKIETPEQFAQASKIAKELQLDGIVIIGGDDSNTNAALLAEYFLSKGVATRVVGVPKTIDGDLKNKEIEISFGFDTATKTFSEVIGNIARDCLSQKKYYFFIKLMGRSASHIALECAMQTHPNMTLIGEEAAEKKQSFQELVNQLADMICLRAEKGKNYGVILIPEGLIEFLPEFNGLIQELNRIKLDTTLNWEKLEEQVKETLSPPSLSCFNAIPLDVRKQLLLDRDPHGNLQVSKIETERLFIEAIKKELHQRKASKKYSGSFSAQPLFCGYEGRSCFPSNFDSQFGYALGHVAALLIDCKETGYMSCVQNLADPVERWQIAAVPLISMMGLEERKGKLKPVIKKALVNLQGPLFQLYNQQKEKWMLQDDYRYPGPIQYFGPPEVREMITMTLEYENLSHYA